MCSRTDHSILLSTLACARFPPQDLYIDKCQVPANLVALAFDDQKISLLGCADVRYVDIDRYATVLEPIGVRGGDDDASDPINDRGGCGTVKDILAVHESSGDGDVRFDVAW